MVGQRIFCHSAGYRHGKGKIHFGRPKTFITDAKFLSTHSFGWEGGESPLIDSVTTEFSSGIQPQFKRHSRYRRAESAQSTVSAFRMTRQSKTLNQNVPVD